MIRDDKDSYQANSVGIRLQWWTRLWPMLLQEWGFRAQGRLRQPCSQRHSAGLSLRSGRNFGDPGRSPRQRDQETVPVPCRWRHQGDRGAALLQSHVNAREFALGAFVECMLGVFCIVEPSACFSCLIY